MRVSQGLRVPIWTTITRRVRNMARTLFARGDFTALLISSLMMLTPVLALNAALKLTPEPTRATVTWPVGLNQLIPIAILSVIFGFLLARSHYSELMALLLSTIYSVGTVMLIQFFAAPGDPLRRIYNIVVRFSNSINNGPVRTGSFDPYLLILFLSVLIWFLGHNTAWHIFRLDRVWRAILPPGIVLVLNNFYNSQPANLDIYLILYLFLALLLIIRSHIEAREFDWYTNRIAFKSGLRVWFLRIGALFAALILFLAWILPTGPTEENAKRFQQFLSQETPAKILQTLNKLFSPLDSKSIATADYYGGEKLTLSGPAASGDGIVMIVDAPPIIGRYYWKSRVFDTYINGTWTASRSATVSNASGAVVINYPDAKTAAPERQEVSQTFTPVIDDFRLVYAAPQPVEVHLPSEFTVDYVAGEGASYDLEVVQPLNPIKKGSHYSVVSSVSTATADFLRAALVNYPAWVTQKNLELPNTIPQRVYALADQTVARAGATTPYDKAKAIESYLRKIKYSTTPKDPPPGRDPVDWMLFDSKEAYCTYYATAMIVMLRHLGIPARLAVGFAQGLQDNVHYTVKEADSHTWVEVYFLNAGWVEFEPTAFQPNLDRKEPQKAQDATQAPSPTPTPTPSPTPTILPTATRSAAGTLPPTNQASQTAVTATPTAQSILPGSPTPVRSPTPTVPPPTFLSLPPPAQDFLSLLLIIAGVVSALSFGVVALVWAIDYRGLDRMSPVGRAYARLAIYARWLGIPLDTAKTPLEQGRQIARTVPTGGRPVIQITDAYISERYGPPRTTNTADEKQAEDAWKRARRVFIGSKIRKWLRRKS